MSTEQNKSMFRQMVDEVFNQGNFSVVDEMMADDFVEHEELPPGIPKGREGLKVLMAQFREAFPDFKAVVEDLVAEGDRVVSRMVWAGTQKGEFMGIPPAGKSFSIEVIDIVRIEGGKIVEHWGIMDNMAMMQQLGAFPEQP